ncbi:MAG: hypothetical protein LBK23_11275 [Oscillospiraceae bacterium]|jgi:hypothetical protein|nr:hypothetical protein [Oscillospiraceae bacterium]
MASSQDYIPAKDADFDSWLRNLVFYVSQKVPAPWTHIPDEKLTELVEYTDEWVMKYRKTRSPHTPVDTAAKTNARKAAEKCARPFVSRYLQYEPVTDDDRTAMGLHNRSTTHTPVPIPMTVPELIVEITTPRRLDVYYRVKGSDHRGKPHNVHGIEVRSAALDHHPTSISELTESSFDTNPPLLLEFDESRRGQKIYLAGR